MAPAARDPDPALDGGRLVALSRDLVCVVDREGRLLGINPAVTGVLGWTAEEVGGTPFSRFLHPDAVARMEDTVRRASEAAVQLLTLRRDGSYVWVDWAATRDVERDLVYLVGRDITERRTLEAARAEAEMRFRAAIEGGFDAFLAFDAVDDGAGGRAYRVVDLNSRGAALLGMPREQVLGNRIDELGFPEERVEYFTSRFDRVYDTGEALAEEFETRTTEPRWLEYQVVPLLNGVAVSARDVTERRRAEDELKLGERALLQAQKMEAVGRLAGGVAHDFNNVLLVIRGYSHVLMGMFGESEDGWAEAKEIETAATRASDLVRQLLAFSRSQVMQTRDVNLNEVVGSTQKLLEPLLGEDVELHTSLDARLGVIKGDQAQLEQALVNLAVNARDAMPNGGTLVIRTRNVVVDDRFDGPSLSSGRYVALSVEDTGLGMTEETRARAFEPFFSTKGGKGSGLGLSTVYGMVKQSGGDITVLSAPDEGTTVTIYLPQAREAAPLRPSPPGAAPGSDTETILLVEDDDKARALVGRLLRTAGYGVFEAGLPEQALRISEEREGDIDLLLSDVVMPQMSGPTLAKRILERWPETQILFVSGYIERADDVDIVSSGADFLQKPFTPTELVQTVQRVLQKRERVEL